MSEYFCPRCGAMLSEDVLYGAGDELDCPECDERIRLQAAGVESGHLPQFVADSTEPQAVEEDPPGDRLQCRVVGEQLVLFVPPGTSGANRAMLFFAVLWLGFVSLFTAAALAAVLSEGKGNWTPLLFLSLFWLVGLGMLYFWFRGRFGKTYILVEPNRLVTKFELLGREKYREYPLGEGSRASLVESYRQNNRPVYAVSVSATSRVAKFGTFLSPEEKGWIVKRINRHLEG